MTYANITNLLETKKFCSALVKAPLSCRIRQSIIDF